MGEQVPLVVLGRFEESRLQTLVTGFVTIGCTALYVLARFLAVTRVNTIRPSAIPIAV